MQTTKLALHTIKNNDSMFDVEITENALDTERISYVVLFNDVLATNAYDDTFYVSFRTAEEADKYVQEYVDKHGMKFVDVDNDTTISTNHFSIDGIKHDVELHRCQNLWRSGYLSVTYEVKAIFGEMENGEICSNYHGYDVYQHETLSDARKDFEFYSTEV